MFFKLKLTLRERLHELSWKIIPTEVVEHPDTLGISKRSMDFNFSSEMSNQVQCYTNINCFEDISLYAILNN